MQALKERKYPLKKVLLLNKLRDLCKKYRCVAVTNLYKVRTSQLVEFKRRLKDKLEIVVAKNTLAKKAFNNFPEEFLKELKGSNAFIFTNLDVFTLYLLMEKNKVNVAAKAGDIATDDIIIPAGNTGLPPGPVLSEFKAFKIPTKVDAGSIWITKDTLVAKKGDVISPALSGLLSKLNIKPIKAGLSISLAYMDGLVFKNIKLDLEEYKSWISSAIKEAYSLALGIGYPTKEVLPNIIAKYYKETLNLAILLDYYDKDTLPILISKAYLQAKFIEEGMANRIS